MRPEGNEGGQEIDNRRKRRNDHACDDDDNDVSTLLLAEKVALDDADHDILFCSCLT